MNDFDPHQSGGLPVADAAALAMNDQRYEDLRQQFSQPMELPQPAFVPNTIVVDTTSLARSQGRFINAQTRFLLYEDNRNNSGGQSYLEAMSAYSKAQTEYITALQQALHQADII